MGRRKTNTVVSDADISAACYLLNTIRHESGMIAAANALRKMAAADSNTTYHHRLCLAAKILLSDFNHLRENGLDEWRAMQVILS